MNRNTTAVILIVLAIGIYFTVTKGMIADAQAVASVNDTYASAIRSAEQLIKIRDKVLKDYNDISADDRARLTKMIPQTVDNIRLVIDLNNLATQQGLALKGVTASAAAAPAAAPRAVPMGMNATGGGAAQTTAAPAAPVLSTVTLGFTVTASYQQFIQFLQALEADLRIMDVTHLSVSANDSGLYDWTVQLKTYWLQSP